MHLRKHFALISSILIFLRLFFGFAHSTRYVHHLVVPLNYNGRGPRFSHPPWQCAHLEKLSQFSLRRCLYKFWNIFTNIKNKKKPLYKHFILFISQTTRQAFLRLIPIFVTNSRFTFDYLSKRFEELKGWMASACCRSTFAASRGELIRYNETRCRLTLPIKIFLPSVRLVRSLFWNDSRRRAKNCGA